MRIRHVPLRAFGPRRLAGFAYFGTPSQYQANVECPVVSGGSWEAWCDCVYPEGDLRNRCRSKPFPGGFLPPWTEAGAGARGLPKPESIVANITGGVLNLASGITGGVVQKPPEPATITLPPVNSGGSATTVKIETAGTPAASAEEGIFGIPKTIALVGGAVLAAGAAALAFSGKRR